jgi:hypothetical protein
MHAHSLPRQHSSYCLHAAAWVEGALGVGHVATMASFTPGSGQSRGHWRRPTASIVRNTSCPNVQRSKLDGRGTDRLHACCLEGLGTQLIADAREAKLAGADEPHWTRRTAGALRSAVLLQEAQP